MNSLTVCVAQTKAKRGGTLATQRTRAVLTRDALIRAARTLFAQQGYAATGTHDLVAVAAVTRGALYHHFTGKEKLFESVFVEVLDDLNKAARAGAVLLAGDIWSQVVGAFTNYLKLIAAQPEFQRILLIDGPAVLGWRRWRELHAEYTASGIEAAFRVLMKQGIIAEQPPRPLANLIQAALNDAALSIAYAENPTAATADASNAFIFLLQGIDRRFRDQPVLALNTSL